MNLPERATIIEVGPRDGFQNVKDFIETEDKVEIIKKMIDGGIKKIEVTSFVHPKWIPQTKDAAQVVKEIKEYAKGKDVELIALVPNKYGAIKAREAGVDTITYVISASMAHNKANVNRTIDESFLELEEIAGDLGGMDLRLGIATTFGCPFDEDVPVSRIIEMAERGLRMGAKSILLADTIGSADPLMVKRILSQTVKHLDPGKLVIHFHDTRGMALVNTMVALEEGITSFESAAGGLGGCPFAPGAAGNVATEDLLNMLHSMGVETGVSYSGVMDVVELIKKSVNSPIVSHMSKLCIEPLI